MELRKRCCRCKVEKTHGEFTKNRSAPDGRQYACRPCRREEKIAGMDKSLARKRHRYRTEPTYRASVLKACRQRYEANPDQFVARMAAWRRANPERHNMNNARRRALQKNAFIENVHSLVLLEQADGICGICGQDVDPFDFHVDHIVPLSRGGEHSYVNTQVAHPSCNVRKWASMPGGEIANTWNFSVAM